MIDILRILTRGMLRTTINRIGVRDTRWAVRIPVILIALTVITANIIGIVVVEQAGADLTGSGPPFAMALLWYQAAGIVVLVQNIGIGQSSIAKGLQLVPLTPLERVAAVSVPLALVAGLSAATLLFPAAALTWDNSPLDPVTSTLLCALVAVTGSCVGFICWALAAAFCEAIEPFRGRTYPISIAVLVFTVACTLPVLGQITGESPPGALHVPDWAGAWFVWPSVAEFALNPHPYWLTLIVTVTVITVLVTGAAAVKVAPLLLREEAPHPRRFNWKPDRPFPLLRLEMIRLTRNRRTMTAVATTLTMGTVGIMGAFLNERRGITTIDVAPVIGVLMTVPASQITLLARGATTRRFPYLLQIGYRPWAWALALNTAALALTITTLTPVMVALRYAPGVDPVALRVVLLYQLVVFAGTCAFGAVVRPSRDNPAGEFIGLLVTSAGAAAGITALASRYGGDHVSLVVFAVAAAAVLLPIPMIVEQSRWGYLLRRPGPVPAEGI